MSAMKEFAKLLKEAQTHQKENKALNDFSKLLKETTIKNTIVKDSDISSDEIQLNNNQEVFLETNNKIETYIKEEKVFDIENVAKSLSKTNEDIEIQRWNDPLRKDSKEKFVTFREMNDHYSNFLNRIQQQLSSIGGGGEVNFRYLDDVNRFTMTSSNDNYVLEYDAASGKVQFTNHIGPIDRISFDIEHIHDEVRTPGTVCWSPQDMTLNIEHPGGVTQQVGQELYAKARNRTGATIPNGAAVMFAGAEENGTSRLLIEPFLGDGTYPSLYGLGITTQDIEDGDDGFVTVWGKVRDIDTSAWNVGDILYVSANTAGGLTNIKPTAPNNVVPIAAVLRKSSTIGEIFVRPTIEQRLRFGRFFRSTTQTANNINEGYTIEFDTTALSNGIDLGSPTSRIVVSDSGFYQFDVSVQVAASSNKGDVHLWFRKNGQDIPLSARSNTISNGDNFIVHSSLQISLNANEYVEIMWAVSASGIDLIADPTPTVGPSVASVLLSVGQIQL